MVDIKNISHAGWWLHASLFLDFRRPRIPVLSCARLGEERRWPRLDRDLGLKVPQIRSESDGD